MPGPAGIAALQGGSFFGFGSAALDPSVFCPLILTRPGAITDHRHPFNTIGLQPVQHRDHGLQRRVAQGFDPHHDLRVGGKTPAQQGQ